MNWVSFGYGFACGALFMLLAALHSLARIEAFGRDPQGLDGEATKAGIAPNISRIANHRERV